MKYVITLRDVDTSLSLTVVYTGFQADVIDLGPGLLTYITIIYR